MANLQIKLSETEVQEIILEFVKRNFSLKTTVKLHINWDGDSGATISTPDAPIDEGSNWLDTDS